MRRLAIVIAAALTCLPQAGASRRDQSLDLHRHEGAVRGNRRAFEKTSGHKAGRGLFGPTGPLTKRIADGETADVVILGGREHGGAGSARARSNATARPTWRAA